MSMRKRKILYMSLAKSIPEFSKKYGGLYSCSLGYSPTLQEFIRVYPLPTQGFGKWELYEIEVEKNRLDSRDESFKLSSYAIRDNGFTQMGRDCILIKKIPNYSLPYKKIFASSIDELNSQSKSIGIVPMINASCRWDVNKNFVNKYQVSLFDEVELSDWSRYTKLIRDKEARISFNDLSGRHDLQINEWGIYEYARKFKANKDAFRYFNKSSILLGNMVAYRNNWIAFGAVDYSYKSQLTLLI